MKEIKIDFETITPIWTGDAWGENSEIKASSIMGSLRIIFSDYCKEKKITLSKLDSRGIVNETFDYLKYKNLINKNSIKEILKRQKISLESQLFGCTGWKSRIVINNIEINRDGDKLQSITFRIDKDFIDEFSQFKEWLQKQEIYIYIGKRQKKKRGGKVKISDKKYRNLKKIKDDAIIKKEQKKINIEVDEKNKRDDMKKNRKTNKHGIRKL